MKAWISMVMGLLLSGTSIDAAPASPVLMHLQVIDVRGQPIRNIGINVSGRGVSGLPTSQDGVMSIRLPAEVEKADSVVLQLDKHSSSKWVFIQPWNGAVTVPKESSSVLIVLAKPGDRKMLESSSGMIAVLSKMERKVAEERRSQKLDFDKLNFIEAKVTKDFGFTPKQVSAAARARAFISDNLQEKALIARYESGFTDSLNRLANVPGYAKKEKQLEQMLKLRNVISSAVGKIGSKLHGFEIFQTGAGYSPERLYVGTCHGVRSMVDEHIAVVPCFAIVVDENDEIVVSATFEGKQSEIYRQRDLNDEPDSKLIEINIENYFEPLLSSVTEKYAKDHRSDQESNRNVR